MFEQAVQDETLWEGYAEYLEEQWLEEQADRAEYERTWEI